MRPWHLMGRFGALVAAVAVVASCGGDNGPRRSTSSR